MTGWVLCQVVIHVVTGCKSCNHNLGNYNYSFLSFLKCPKWRKNGTLRQTGGSNCKGMWNGLACEITVIKFVTLKKIVNVTFFVFMNSYHNA